MLAEGHDRHAHVRVGHEFIDQHGGGFLQRLKLGLAGDEVDYEDDDFLIRPASAQQVKKYIKACHNQYARRGTAGIEQWVYDAPEKATKVLAHWYEDLDEVELYDLVRKDPDEAAQWIQDLFTSDSITPSWLG